MCEDPYGVNTERKDVRGAQALWKANGRANLTQNVGDNGMRTEGIAIGGAQALGKMTWGWTWYTCTCIPPMRSVK